jgi:hypothetical protein
MMGSHVAEEAVNGAQPHITGANRTMSGYFEVLQERRDSLGTQLLKAQLTGIAPASHELQ